jgi:membrane protein YdbS with pleckstrin-like domain
VAALLAIAPVICVGGAILALVAGAGVVAALAGVVVLTVVYGGLVFPMRYGITDEEIVVRHGVVRQRIPLAKIREVYPTRSPVSSPALSLDRLHIQFGDGFFKAAMISPADKDGFLQELARKAGLARDGDRLVRA